jgi:hypothetical protein
MDAAVAGLLGAAIGALAGVIGSVLTAWQQNRMERERRQAAQRDESLKVQRQALLHLTELIATGTQAILWLSWAAGAKSNIRQEIDVYETRMRGLLPQLVVAQAAAAAVTDEAFRHIVPLANNLTILDTKIGTAAAKFSEGDDKSRRLIAETKQEAIILADSTVLEVRAALRALEQV